ncbi:MAG: phosphotransferase, partial [Lacipirellulaceae bacterium]
ETLESLKRPAFQETLRELIAASDSPQTQRFKHMYGELLKTLPLVYEEVLRATDHELPLQWILGDVHREHFLFTNGQVTGLVDFGAVCVDSRVRDIARLLDSIALDDPERWEVGVQAYQQVSPLTPDELAVLAAFDSGGVAVAAYRWLHWLVVEGRQLAPEAVAARLEHLAGRLEALNRRGRASVLPPS